jgi:hypothetical protein
MSKRSRTLLTLSVTLPLPTTETQAAFITRLTQFLVNQFGHEVLVKMLKREVTYL